MSGTWTSTLLWLVPLGGALLALILPLGDRVRGAFALLVTLVTAALALAAALSFKPSGGTQFEQSHAWVRDIGLTYHVGMDGLSLVLVALTAICVPCALGFGLWARRPNLRGYTSLMLLLESAVVLLLVARDLALFYVGFEAMIVPLALLIAVWGGPNRGRATIRFVIYTLVGSLLMLVGVITLGLRAGTFDLARGGTSDSRWLFLAFMAAFAIKAPLYPFHGWVPDAYREAPPEVSGLLSGRGLEGRRVRHAALRAAALPRAGARPAAVVRRDRRDRPAVVLPGRLPPARLARRDRVLLDLADEPDRPRHLRHERHRRDGRDVPDGQPRPALGARCSCSRASSRFAPATASSAASAPSRGVAPGSRRSS